MIPIPPIKDPRRFWSKVAIGPDCWEWQGSRQPKGGYGKFTINKRFFGAHRVAYTLAFGPIEDELHIDHLCRNPPCVRPTHLELVTPGENSRRWACLVTHCPRGHLYDEANTYYSPKPGRICRACGREKARERKQRHWLERDGNRGEP